MKQKLIKLSVLLVSTVLFFACSKDENGEPAKITQLPAVGDVEISSKTTASFVYKASILNEGSSAITEKGICYGTSENPTTSNTKITNGKGKASFSGSVEKLTAEKTYFVRAYATNSEGTGYGKQAKVSLLALKTLVGAEEAYPGEKGEVVTATLNGVKVKCSKINGQLIFQGDIVISEKTQTKGVAINEEESGRWKNNTVVYKIDEGFRKKERIAQAIEMYYAQTNIKFKERTNEPNYVLFKYHPRGCNSYLGMVGGEQIINIADWGTAGNVAHEIGHALGLFHEQSHPNRDKFIKVNVENIIEGYEHNFEKYDVANYYTENYDFGSIMAYPSSAFSKNGKPTMVKLDGKEFGWQREKFSTRDIEILNRLYPKLADLSIFRTEISLEVGESAKVEITAGTGEYEIQSENTDIATASLSKNMITISALKEGVARIVITDKNTEQSQTIKVTVSPKTPDLAIDKTVVSLEVEQTVTENITAGSGNYTLTSSNEKIATATEKGGKITLTAKGEGTATITIKDNKTEQTKTIKVSVTAKTPNIAIGTPKINSLEKGKTATLLTITAGSGNYTVTSSATKKATVTEKDGVVTVTAVSEGDVTITIKDNKTGQTKTVKLKVTAKTADLAIEKTEVSLEEEQIATVNITAGSGKYTVTSSDTKKATVTEKDGVVTITAVNEGDVTITIKDNKTRQTKTVKVKVMAKTPNLAIETTEGSLEVGKIAVVKITAGSGNYTVTSSDTNKATATEKEGVIIITAKAEGTATITIKDNKTEQTKTVKVIVNDLSTYIELTTTKAVGEKIQLKINAEEEDKENIWIDLNNNKIRESGEKIKKFDNDAYGHRDDLTDYVLGSQTIRIYGKVTLFSCGRFSSQGKWIRKRDIIHLDVSNNPMLKKLNCTENTNLNRLNISKNIHLEYLDCANCNLTNLDVSKNFKLKSLYCGENKFTEIDISNNEKLVVFHCSENLLKSLNLSKNKKLRYLHCSSSLIRDLDLSQNAELGRLECHWTRLSKLDVSKNTKLHSLYCYGNNLTDIDVSKNVNITEFDCSNNQLSSLDISNCRNLEKYYSTFNCTENPNLTCIKVSQEQLNNTEKNWKKDDNATYSTDCNKTTEPVSKTVTYTNELVFKCDVNEYDAYTVSTQQMNEDIYSLVNMSKDDFHNKFNFENTTSNLGTLQEENSKLVYKLTRNEVLRNMGETVVATAKYTDGSNVINIEFRIKITRETIDIKKYTLANYWNDGYKYIIHNVAIPNVGSNDDTQCTFRNNISYAFYNLEEIRYEKNYAYEYVFNKKQPNIGGRQLKASVDGKTLVVEGGITIARIEGEEIVYQDNEYALELLNLGMRKMKATVKMVIKNECGRKLNVEGLANGDKFDVYFLRPINITKKQSEKYFVDGVDSGAEGSYIDVMELVPLADWRNAIKNTTDYDFSKNLNYYGYYGVRSIVVDVRNIKVVGLNGDESINLPSSILIKHTETEGGKNSPYGFLTYQNSGTNLNGEITLKIPVVVIYKWGKLEELIEVKVKPTSKK